MIRSEDGKLVAFVFVDTDRPIADYVEEAKAVVAERVELPVGLRLGWPGQFRYFERAKAKLKLVVPLTLGLVVLLLFWNTRSPIETGIVLLAVPFSLIGAVWLLFLTRLQHERGGVRGAHRAHRARRGDGRRGAPVPAARLRPARQARPAGLRGRPRRGHLRGRSQARAAQAP
jgi:hypothetical protein